MLITVLSAELLSSSHLQKTSARWRYRAFSFSGNLEHEQQLKCRVKLCVVNENGCGVSSSCLNSDEYKYTLFGK